MHIPSPTVLTIGDWQMPEFAQLRSELDAHTPWPAFATWPDALAAISDSSSLPDLVLWAQARPYAVNQQPLDQLCRTSPLTRVVVVAGTWCEGELRTGQPPQGVVRLYWYEFAPWWRAALSRAAAGLTPPWAEPMFDPRAGQFIGSHFANSGEPLSNERRLVAIDCLDYGTFEALQLGLRGEGWGAHWQPRRRPEIGGEQNKSAHAFSAGIWDGSQLDETERSSLRSFCMQMRDSGAPVIALLDFPRFEHQQAIQELGASEILGKPYQLSLLIQELDRLTAAVA
jgi:hypothetical protein